VQKANLNNQYKLLAKPPTETVADTIDFFQTISAQV
jgi:hypothetical protein